MRSLPSGASAETSANGNSGSPSYSQKVPNSTAQAVRQVPSGGSDLSASTPIRTQSVQVSGASLPSDPVAQAAAANSAGDSSFVTDSYRTSRVMGSITDSDYNDDDPAAMSIVTNTGDAPIDLYTRFFLQSISEADTEKYQIVETFTAFYAFFYGKRPPVYRYSGILLNDDLHNWMNDFRYLYENFMRGTAAAEIGATVVIDTDKRIVTGYVLGLTINQDAMNDKGVPFAIDLLVIDNKQVGYSQDFQAFVSTQTEYLRKLKEQAADYITRLTKGADTTQTQVRNSALNGILPLMSLSEGAKIFSASPVSQQSSTQGPSADTVLVPGVLNPATHPASGMVEVNTSTQNKSTATDTQSSSVQDLIKNAIPAIPGVKF